MIKNILKRILIVFLVIIILVLVINLPINQLKHNETEQDYSNWMSETLSTEQKIIDIAMLGAHDAFSNEINLFSQLDPYESNDLMRGITGLLTKGFILRQSITQVSDVTTLLNSGVRYFDIRLTYEESQWWTKHNYLSGDFEEIAMQLKTFLEDHPGEFLILDFQHIHGLNYTKASDYQLFTKMLEDTELLDFAYDSPDLSTLTYGMLTNEQTEAGVLITSKFEDSSGKVLPYQDSVRSNWADTDSFSGLMEFLIDEAAYVKTNALDDRLVVMQAVLTMQMNAGGIYRALMDWSLINRAKDFNDYLINREEFYALLDDLPIIMVDYANTNRYTFNDDIMEIIMDFNENS